MVKPYQRPCSRPRPPSLSGLERFIHKGPSPRPVPSPPESDSSNLRQPTKSRISCRIYLLWYMSFIVLGIVKPNHRGPKSPHVVDSGTYIEYFWGSERGQKCSCKEMAGSFLMLQVQTSNFPFCDMWIDQISPGNQPRSFNFRQACST